MQALLACTSLSLTFLNVVVVVIENQQSNGRMVALHHWPKKFAHELSHSLCRVPACIPLHACMAKSVY